MKTFFSLRESTKPKGKVVFKKKMNRIDVLITKDTGSLPFVAYVDGDKLDSYKNQRDAEKAIKATIKELT
tara:strand:- start:1233 stop:1442 length:210 start_codon:yes stop_codon:yes gene_type:complete